LPRDATFSRFTESPEFSVDGIESGAGVSPYNDLQIFGAISISVRSHKNRGVHLMKARQHRLFAIVIVFAISLIATAVAGLVSANQSPEPLTGNWVVRTPSTNNDGTFR